MKIYLYICIFFSSFVIASENKWLGDWIAFDEWQSEFTITLKKNGNASSNYANGDLGEWYIVDGNVKIEWESGKDDFIFNGVMGLQRLHKSKNSSYTSGISKKLLN